jgi:hypothetical protein
MRGQPKKRFDMLFSLLHKYGKRERPTMPCFAHEMAENRFFFYGFTMPAARSLSVGTR